MTQTCACGAITWNGGTLSVWSDDVHHWPEGLVCYADDELWAAGVSASGEQS
jgi:hypothetical protein